MSLLNGGDASCSGASNPLSQFSKHVQDDKSLQRDCLVGRAPGGMQESFRDGPPREAAGRGDEMMSEFLRQPSHMPPPVASPMVMDRLQRNFKQMHTAPQQNGSSNWATEFGSGMGPESTMNGRVQDLRPLGINPSEFRSYMQNKPPEHSAAQPASIMNDSSNTNGFQRPVITAFGRVEPYNGVNMGMSTGMGMYQQPSLVLGRPTESVQTKGKDRMVELDDKDWEAQFAELESANAQQTQPETLDDEASRAMENELDQLDVQGHGRGYNRQFEALWQRIQAEHPALRDLASKMPDWKEHTGFDQWDNFDSTNLNTHLRDPEMGKYLFEEDNIFSDVSDPFSEGVKIMDEGGNLSLAALAFEAAVQKDSSHFDAWVRLGAAQAQNEKESPAIRAFEQAQRHDPGNLDAMMGLAVSYTNEGYETTAYCTLQKWLVTKYPQLSPNDASLANTDPATQDIGFTDRALLHERVTDLFIKAAQLSPDPTTMDPDVQVGLGVLFYGVEAYDKAVDCFNAALASSESGSTNQKKANQRPLLWNRLGATLANSGRSEEAIGAYERALELNPNFVRARYNLGVSCINIGCYAEAATHLLGALDMHMIVEREGREKAKQIVDGARSGDGGESAEESLNRMIRHNQSTNLYETLRRVFKQMNRNDLADRVGSGMDPATFRGEFEF